MKQSSETPSAASSQPTEQVSCEHTLAEWEFYRELFKQLYVVEDRTLPEVRVEMASRYGFRAT